MTGGETADQMTRMTLQGIEVAAEISMKAGGSVAKSLAAMLYAILTDQKKVKGKTRLDSMLKSGKELKVFAIRHKDLKLFCEEAKRYGVLYSVLKEKNNTDGICDIMVRAEDAAKISRIVDKFELATIDTNVIRESIMNERHDPLKDVAILNDKEHDDLVNALLSSVKKKESNLEDMSINPNSARTDKNRNSQSENSLKKTQDSRPSVREDLKRYKQEVEKSRLQQSQDKTKELLKSSKLKKTKER